LQLVAAVLLLGQVTFAAQGADRCTVAPDAPLAAIAALLGTDTAALAKVCGGWMGCFLLLLFFFSFRNPQPQQR
jgi:hypothetical protein